MLFVAPDWSITAVKVSIRIISVHEGTNHHKGFFEDLIRKKMGVHDKYDLVLIYDRQPLGNETTVVLST